jgi:predicted nucleic acid-binding protein
VILKSQVCVDASLALKLVIAEEDSPLAHELWETWVEEETEIISPPLFAFEGISVIRNKVHCGLVPSDEGELMFKAFRALGVKLLYPEGLHERAWEMANRFHRPQAYDSHYLALAEMLGCDLWTADKRLYNAVKDELSWVKWLSNQPEV